MKCALLVMSALAAQTTAVAFVTDEWLLGGLSAGLTVIAGFLYLLERERVWWE
jgi:hypothetical protein